MKNYEDMPFRGKISPTAWENLNRQRGWGDNTRRYRRKHHRHYDPYEGWWGSSLHYKWEWHGRTPSKSYRRKTWKDFY